MEHGDEGERNGKEESDMTSFLLGSMMRMEGMASIEGNSVVRKNKQSKVVNALRAGIETGSASLMELSFVV